MSEVLRTISDKIDLVNSRVKTKITINLIFVTIEIDLSELFAFRANLRANADRFTIMFDQCFTQRDLYIAPLTRETVADVQNSATEIRDTLREHINNLPGLRTETRKILEFLLAWETSAGNLGRTLHRQRPMLSGNTWLSKDRLSAEALVKFRTETLPSIGVMITLLENGDAKTRAEARFKIATNLLTAQEVVAVSDSISAN